ncbi:MAG: hypothetical protein ACFFCI_04270 [Promethearchaeota archaeon]
MQTIEPYTDYKFWYQPTASQFLYNDWLPYIKLVNLFDNPEKLRPFIYPPLFFYVLIIPSFISLDLVAIPLLLSNILLPIVVYKFLNKSYTQKVAEWGFIATALCPLYLFYSGGMALNSSLVTFFFILSLYFTSIDRFNHAIIFLSISILFKQVALLMFPPILLYLTLESIKGKDKAKFLNFIKKFVQYLTIFGLVLFVGSLPWIMISPSNYIISLTAYGTFRPTLYPYFGPLYGHHNIPRFWYDFLIYLNPPYEVYYVFGFLNFSYVGLLITEVLVIIIIFYWYYKNNLDKQKFLNIILYTAFLTYLFFPRGNYKYYYSFFVPLIILWICSNYNLILLENKFKRRNWILIVGLVSIAFMLIHRNYYQLLVWGIFIYIIIQNRILNKRKNIGNFTNMTITNAQDNNHT